MSKNLWILTEEKPNRDIIAIILSKFSADTHMPCFIDTLRILPIMNKDKKFSFLYEVIGFRSNKIDKIYLKLVSGYSSFVDFLLFYQENEPTAKDKPLYAVEETKTDDSESRNTGIYQRASKFIYIDHYYQNIKKIMLYHLQVAQKIKPTQTYILGSKCLLALGVEILGKENLDPEIFVPFKSIEELIDFKSKMRKAPKGNVQINIIKEKDRIKISGRLYKSNTLSHDPNIGGLSLISATLRKLGWKGDIIITEHGLKQEHLKSDNKFIKIANLLNIKIDGLKVPNTKFDPEYWKYETEGEK
jgi:hypothetical protein